MHPAIDSTARAVELNPGAARGFRALGKLSP